MNVEACRNLLSNAWVGITSHNTYFTCDPDYFDNFEDDEILEWTAKIISGAAKLGYNIAKYETMTPVLID